MKSSIESLKDIAESISNISELNKFDSLNSSLVSLSNTIENMNTLCKSSNRWSDLNLSYIEELINKNSFSSMLSDCINEYNESLKKIYNNANLLNFSYISEIVDKMYNYKFSIYDNLSDIADLELDFIDKSTTLREPERIIKRDIGYSLRNDSKISPEIAFDNSLINLINIEGEKIISNMNKIHELDNEIFVGGTELATLGFNITRIVENDAGLKELSDYLYKGIYETSGGSNNKIIKILEGKNITDKPMMLIKHLRGKYNHSTGAAVKKIKFVHDFNKKVISKKLPETANEFKKIQLALYKEINKMFNDVLYILNNR